MKLRVYIGVVLMAVMVGCKSPTTSPRPSSVEEGEAYRMLVEIDSLMWQQPDSALAMLLEYLSCRDAMIVSSNDAMDTMRRIQCVSTTFDSHYAQLLTSELLFKNNYAQSNRTELLQAVAYFDSLLVMTDGADARGVSLRPDPRKDASHASVKTMAFLVARAHYINGAGYYERDSLIEACTEYLCALRTMENHFAENEMVGTKARFMALTYNRLVEIFSAQFMQEPAIYCGKQSLSYDKIAQTSPDKIANTYFSIAKQYGMLYEEDSAAYYYNMVLEIIPNKEILQQRVTDIYQSNGKDRLQRILEAVDDTYPQTVARLKSEYPELSETERNILLLNFFHFRIKEEADLLGLSENTVAKYRSELLKKVGKSPISDLLD